MSLEPSTYSCAEHRTKPILPVAHRFIADPDTLLMQQFFNVAQRHREPDLKHHRQAADLWAGHEVAGMGTIGHRGKLEAPR